MDEAPPPPTDFVAPTLEELTPLFPAYELNAFIAQGGMGAVYKARQKSLDRDVAIKILPREFGDDPQFRASFEAEAKAMARLNHPNLISVYDFGDIDGMLFIIMEFVQGKALFYSAHRKIIDPKVALPLVSTISRGLAHAHKGGIIHRDIKPANILLDTDATPKIGDFGLARPVELDDSEGIVFGTPGYTAPEVFHRQPVDQRSDIFSVGALLYELLVGKHPTPESTSMTTGLDPRIDAILVKATHASPNQRYDTVNQLADDLDALLPKLSAPQFAAPAKGTAGAKPQPTLASQKKSSTLPILVVLALLGGAAAFFILNKDKPETPIVEQPEEETEVKEPKRKKPKNPKKERPNQKPRPEKEVMANKPSPKTEPIPEPEPEPKPKPEPQQESTLAALKTLRAQLHSGQRDQFPPSSVERNGSRFCLVTRQLSWLRASSFARRHGAQLAVLKSPEDLTWAKETFQPKTALWLGASDAGMEGKWYWVEGQALETALWDEAQPDDTASDQDGEDYAALSPEKNSLEDLPQDRKLPFLLEWKLDGSNPGSLEQQLTRNAAALNAKKAPIFPNGTRNIGGSRFLFIDKKLTWSQAKDYAEKSGGHLAVASNQNEATYINQLLTPLLTEELEGCWLGGLRTAPSASTWTTVTGERFAFVNWLPNQPDNSESKEDYLQYIFIHKELGHNDGSDEKEWASAFLIEWSHPSMRNMPEDGEALTSTDHLADQLELIRVDFRKKHGREHERYQEKRAKIINGFVDDAIDELENALDTPAAALAQRGIDYMNGIKKEMDLPDELHPGFSGRISKKFKEAKEKSSENWSDYETPFNEAHSYYSKQLESAIVSATKAGNEDAALYLTKELETTREERHRHGKILSGEPIDSPTPENEAAQDYVGRWESRGEDDKKVKFTLNPDGTAVLHSHGGGEGKWAVPEGTDYANIKINDYEIQVKVTNNGLRAKDQENNRYMLTRVE